MSAISSSPIARAISELETERQNLAVRIGKVDEAIASLRALFHLPADRVISKPAAPPAQARSAGSTDTIRAALANGPLSPGALALAVGMDRAVLRTQLRTLEQDGVLVVTGTTASRRVALAAKEAL